MCVDDLCGGPLPKLFVGVLSAPQYIVRRASVRASWMRDTGGCATVRFIVGAAQTAAQRSAIEREQAAHGDLVIDESVEEDYLKLIEKTVALFRFAVASPAGFTHVMKTDDDAFVSLPRLCADLAARTSVRDAYYGFFHNRSFVIRAPDVKFAEPDQNDCQHHIPYASGAAYVLTRRLCEWVVENRPRLRTFRNEDVALGFWLAPLVLQRVHQPRIRPERAAGDTWEQLCPALAANDLIVQHRLRPDEMLRCQ